MQSVHTALPHGVVEAQPVGSWQMQQFDHSYISASSSTA